MVVHFFYCSLDIPTIGGWVNDQDGSLLGLGLLWTPKLSDPKIYSHSYLKFCEVYEVTRMIMKKFRSFLHEYS